MIESTPGGRRASCGFKKGTCILHLTSSMGVSSTEVKAPETAPQKTSAESGRSLVSVRTVAWRASWARRYWSVLGAISILTATHAEKETGGLNSRPKQRRGDAPVKPQEAVLADRLAEAVERARVGQRAGARLGLQADLDRVEGVLDGLANDAGNRSKQNVLGGLSALALEGADDLRGLLIVLHRRILGHV